MKNKLILLVDDDQEDRFMIKDAIDSMDETVVMLCAENGEEAIRLLKNCSEEGEFPCVIVLDLNMPKMNGTETLRQIREQEDLKNIPVIIYSTSVNPIEKERCLKLGAHDYYTKPVSFAECNATAKKFLEFCIDRSVSL
jgi:CheY-like chemotaxis protein